MDHVETFNQRRSLLFSIAYRMTGSAMDSDDILQEAFLRWQSAPADDVQYPNGAIPMSERRRYKGDHLANVHAVHAMSLACK
ncbi:MAG: sigma factor [Chloroflexota bacterium]